MWEFECPVCKSDNTVLPVGPKSSSVLIVGDRPGKQELNEGKPFVGATGGILRTELGFYSIDVRKIRVTNLWLHEPNKNDGCLEHGMKKVLEESIGKKVILLVGSETVQHFCGLSVESWNGLEVKCDWFPEARVMACVQPTTAFHGSCGEIRFALKNFSELLKELK